MNKHRNAILLVIFGTLLLTWFALDFMFEAADSTFANDFPEINPAEIHTIKIYSAKENHTEVILYKKGEEWRVLKGIKDMPVHDNFVGVLLTEFEHLKPTRLSGVDRDKWPELGMNDSTTTRVIAETDDGVVIDFIIGNFQYMDVEKAPLGREPPGAPDQRGLTFVRLTDKEEVYGTEGFFGPNFNQPFETWRDHKVVEIDPFALDSVKFEYTENTFFTIYPENGEWFFGERVLNPVALNNFMRAVSHTEHSYFADGFITDREPMFTVTFYLKSEETEALYAFEANSGQIIINSTQNRETYFLDYDELLLDNLFPPPSFLLTGEFPQPE